MTHATYQSRAQNLEIDCLGSNSSSITYHLSDLGQIFTQSQHLQNRNDTVFDEVSSNQLNCQPYCKCFLRHHQKEKKRKNNKIGAFEKSIIKGCRETTKHHNVSGFVTTRNHSLHRSQEPGRMQLLKPRKTLCGEGHWAGQWPQTREDSAHSDPAENRCSGEWE